jgi:hypothetical protein
MTLKATLIVYVLQDQILVSWFRRTAYASKLFESESVTKKISIYCNTDCQSSFPV